MSHRSRLSFAGKIHPDVGLGVLYNLGLGSVLIRAIPRALRVVGRRSRLQVDIMAAALINRRLYLNMGNVLEIFKPKNFRNGFGRLPSVPESAARPGMASCRLCRKKCADKKRKRQQNVQNPAHGFFRV